MHRRSSIPIRVLARLAVLLTIAARNVSPGPTKTHDIALEALPELVDSLDEDSPKSLLELVEDLPELRMFSDDDNLEELRQPKFDSPLPPELDLNPEWRWGREGSDRSHSRGSRCLLHGKQGSRSSAGRCPLPGTSLQ